MEGLIITRQTRDADKITLSRWSVTLVNGSSGSEMENFYNEKCWPRQDKSEDKLEKIEH